MCFQKRTTDVQASRDLQEKNRRKVAKMVAIVVILFAVSWLPIHILMTWMAFDPLFKRTLPMYYFKVFANTLSYTNSCVNPFVYSFLGDGFRRAFRHSFPDCFPSNCVSPSHALVSKRSFNRGSSNRSNRSYGSQRTSSCLAGARRPRERARSSSRTRHSSVKSRSEVEITVCDDNGNSFVNWTNTENGVPLRNASQFV